MSDSISTTQHDEISVPAAAGDAPVSVLQKAAWGAGGLTDSLIWNTINSLALPIYNIALGVSPILIGYAMAIPRILDVIVDPFIGNLSDNTRSRWGRRRPFIAIGAFVIALFFVLLWMPPLSLSKNGLFWYFLVFSILAFSGYPLWSVAYSALGYELSMDHHERTRVMAWRMYFVSIGSMFVPWLYKLTMLPIFGGKEVIGVRYVGLLVGVLILISGSLSAFFCRERTQSQSQPKVKVLDGMKMTLTNRPFLILMGMFFCIQVGLNVAYPFLTYVNIYYVCQGNKAFASMLVGASGTIGGIMLILATPLVTYASAKWGKRDVCFAGIMIAALGFASNWFLITPAHPYLQFIPSLLITPGQTCIWVLVGSMLADTCDVDELRSGLRREGMFGAVFGQMCKASIAGVAVLVGYMLKMSGFIDGASVQPAHTLLYMRVIYIIVPTVFLLIAGALTLMYPITSKKALEVRATLDARKKDEIQAAQSLS